MKLCDAISDNMIAYHQMYQSMEAKFEGCELNILAGPATRKPMLWLISARHALLYQMESFMKSLLKRSIKVKKFGSSRHIGY
jgi:hypothetical protein